MDGHGPSSEKSKAALVSYASDFGTFLQGASPNLPAQAVTDLAVNHAQTLLAVVVAQAMGDQNLACTRLREATAHMQMIGDPLAETILKQFPDKFA